MTEREVKTPDLLAIGPSTGGISSANQLLHEALASNMRMVIKERGLFPNEGLRVNIVFQIPGPISKPDFAARRTSPERARSDL